MSYFILMITVLFYLFCHSNFYLLYDSFKIIPYDLLIHVTTLLFIYETLHGSLEAHVFLQDNSSFFLTRCFFSPLFSIKACTFISSFPFSLMGLILFSFSNQYQIPCFPHLCLLHLVVQRSRGRVHGRAFREAL